MNNIVIDVRQPEEYQQGHVDGALNIPLDKLTEDEAQLDSVSKGSSIVVYCRTGMRANAAVKALQNLGYTHVTNGINSEQVEAMNRNDQKAS